MTRLRGFMLAALVGAAAIGAPQAAHAWWRGGGGVFVGVGVVPFPVPFYAPPPVVYAPPPVVFDPNQPGPGLGQATTCDAGPYMCPLDAQVPPGAPCSCPANRGRVQGTAR